MSLSFGTEKEFLSSNGANHVAVATLSPSKFVVAYSDAADSNHGTCRIGTISGSDVTFGAESEFLSSNGAGQLGVAALSDTQFVVVWNDSSASNHGRAKVGTVSGSSITYGSYAEFYVSVLQTAAVLKVRVTALSSTQVVVTYHPGQSGYGIVGTVSGSGLTFGTGVQYHSGYPDCTALATLSSTTVVVAYAAGSAYYGTCKIGTVNGSNLTWGAAKEFYSYHYPYYMSLAAMSSTQFVVCWANENDSWNGVAQVATVSGTDITYGAQSEYLSANGVTDFTGAVKLSSSRFAVCYRDASDTNHGTCKVGTISGTTISFGSETEFLSANTLAYIAVSELDAGVFIVAYQDSADSNHGTCKIGTESSATTTTAPPTTTTTTVPPTTTTTVPPTTTTTTTTTTVPPTTSTTSTVPPTTSTTTTLAPTTTTTTTTVPPTTSTTSTVPPTTSTTTTLAPTLGFCSEHEFLSNNGTFLVGVSALTASSFVVAYDDAWDGGKGKCRVATVSGCDVTFGAAAEYAANTGDLSVCALDSTSFVVCYIDDNDSSHETAKVGVISGTNITFGSEKEFLSTGTPRYVCCRALSSAKFVVAYRNGTGSSYSGYVSVGTVSGTDITFGAASAFFTGAGNLSRYCVAVLDSTHFVVGYSNLTPNPDVGQCIVGHVSGTTVSWGAASSHWSGNSFDNANFGLCALDSSHFVVVYGGTAGTSTYAKFGTVAGVSITFGSATTLIAAIVKNAHAVALDSSRFVALYADTSDAGHGTAALGTVSGTAIAFDAAVEFLSANGAGGVISCPLDSGRFSVAYSDASDASHGTVKVGYESTMTTTTVPPTTSTSTVPPTTSTTSTVPPTTSTTSTVPPTTSTTSTVPPTTSTVPPPTTTTTTLPPGPSGGFVLGAEFWTGGRIGG